MKYMTLLIIPYPGADVRSIRIRHRTLKLIALAAVLVVCLSVGALIYLRPILNKAREFDRLQAENYLLSMENQKIRDLSKKIESINQLVGKIQTAQGVSRVTEKDKNESAGEQPAGLYLPENFTLNDGKTVGASGNAQAATDEDVKMPHGLPIAEKSYISRFFNPDIYHFGIDIVLKQGTPVSATADGVVSVADKNEDLGYYVMIKHASGYSTLYAHNSRLTVANGDRIKKGDLIAYSGNMGQSSGPHLHYAIFDQNGNPIDPLPFLER